MGAWDDNAGIVSSDANYKQMFAPYVEQVSATSINVLLYTLGMPAGFNPAIPAPTSYKFTYQRLVSIKNPGSYPATTVTSATNITTITGLVEGALYKITTQAIGPTSEGNKMSVNFKLTGKTSYPTILKSSTGESSQANKIKGKSYLELTGGNTSDNKYTYAYRDFDAIQVPTASSIVLDPASKVAETAPSYPNGPYYYSFGTSVSFPPLSVYEPQEAGLGFFLSDKADSGYYVTFATSGTASAGKYNPIRIMKVTGKQIKVLKDNQIGAAATLDTLFSGSVHNVDIKVKVGASSATGKADETITITVYIDGFEIEATDVNSGTAPYNKILPITKKVALLAASGKSSFDYVYATSINADQYNVKSANNLYIGQFSADYLLTQYGDILYDASNDDDTVIKKDAGYDEFGTVAREIIKRDVKFGSGASIPNKWTLGGNTRISILAEDKSHFGSSVFALNNTSTTVPLADGELNSFAVYGYKVGFSGDIEYATDPVSEYAVKEPASFESTWLQNESDVKELADWIRSKVVNKSKIINMNVFGNPLIGVGDIITVNYPYHGFYGTEKIIVTHVTQSYENGLQTTIRGRTI